jgi:hypothetical protein
LNIIDDKKRYKFILDGYVQVPIDSKELNYLGLTVWKNMSSKIINHEEKGKIFVLQDDANQSMVKQIHTGLTEECIMKTLSANNHCIFDPSISVNVLSV